ncbi:Uncharacterized protein PECH_003952 [Penicillium ucsense]|uniref:Aminoglycoside phosphotransferase domain-containing protein n=1 Tax=Penicillium ucsense TaxID=2839758 RepID=A0A8J8WGD5_9EURO|nr:Uncharacterized protein PECM_008937 [Penicillium ucsense]KAF7728974.1 Uncharacterized protein PECH_003952 [Penicillium ucsense]
MDTETICSACSWSPTRQSHCRYHSHVKLFYSAGNRGAWSLGSKFILKERDNNPPNNETSNIRFLTERTSIPIPQVVEEWTEDDGTHFLLTKRIPGQCLEEAWPTLSAEDKERVAKQTAEYLMQLRDLRSDRMECLGGTPLHSAFMFGDDYKTGHGPMTSDDELWAEMSRYLSHVPEEARSALRRRMPSAAPYTFTHGDLTIVNLMVDKGHLAGILDWEGSGYFPVWWEFTHAGISLSTEDAEWKALLRKYLPDHTEGQNGWGKASYSIMSLFVF